MKALLASLLISLLAREHVIEALALSSTAVVWFRDHCLRTRDNEALAAAVASKVVVPIFLWPSHDDGKAAVDPATGGTAKDVFVTCAIDQLNSTLGGKLRVGLIADDSPSTIATELESICSAVGSDTVYYPLTHSSDTEEELQKEISVRKIMPKTFGSSFSLLDYTFDKDVSVPWKDIIQSHPFRSPLIPFVDWLLSKLEECPPRKPLPRPVGLEEKLHAVEENGLRSPTTIGGLIHVHAIGKSPGGHDWGRGIIDAWPASEKDAMENLENFLASVKLSGDDIDNATESSATKRTHLASRLSPYLARGVLSPQQVYDALLTRLDSVDTASFVRRLCWRDYTYAVTALFPDIENGQPIREAYYSDGAQTYGGELDAETRRRFDLWKEGRTGFPLVDAGLRQLVSEGWMPQKVRLAASACLVEGLDVPWEVGMQHFAEYLVDYDASINANMWQNAGCVGFDPYYVGLRYKKRPYWDRDGKYVRRWIPELKSMPDFAEVPEAQRGTGLFRVDCLYEPWSSPIHVLEDAGIELGATYPHRACDERSARSAFFGRLRVKRKEWSTELREHERGGLDNVRLGRHENAERIGIFTPKALLDKRQFRLQQE